MSNLDMETGMGMTHNNDMMSRSLLANSHLINGVEVGCDGQKQEKDE